MLTCLNFTGRMKLPHSAMDFQCLSPCPSSPHFYIQPCIFAASQETLCRVFQLPDTQFFTCQRKQCHFLHILEIFTVSKGPFTFRKKKKSSNLQLTHFLVVLRIELRVLCMCSTTELYPNPTLSFNHTKRFTKSPKSSRLMHGSGCPNI